MSVPPKLVLPPPAPQSEQDGLQAGGKIAEPIPVHPPNGAAQPVRKDGGSARHPLTARWTKYRG